MIDAMALIGNPSSVHAEGRRAKSIVTEAREKIAALLGASPRELMFTSGGTEANNYALSPSLVAQAKDDETQALCFISAIEHPSVIAGGRFRADNIRHIPVDGDGVVDIDAFVALLDDHGFEKRAAIDADKTPLYVVSITLANNETGVVQPVTEIAGIVIERGGIMHTDAVQALGRMPFDLQSLGVDLLTIAAHKIGGPKGIGALVGPAIDKVLNDPLVKGGGQEFGRRAGTENIVAIAGFAAAAELACDELADREMVRFLRDRLESRLQKMFPDLVVFSEKVDRLDNTSLFAVPGLRAETLVMALDLEGLAVSSGSACSSGKVAPSHVLSAMGVSPELAGCAIRVSFGPDNWLQDVDRLVNALGKIAKTRANVAAAIDVEQSAH
jgi:cysteine desulfurase